MSNPKIVLTGVHLELTDAMKNIATHKVEKLLRHDSNILSIRIELESRAHKNNPTEFVAKGHVDIRGPHIIVGVSSENLYKSIDLLIDKLDRKLIKRARLTKEKRRFKKSIDLGVALPKIPALQY